MADIRQTATEVFAPPMTLQVWRTLVNWLTFVFHILGQIIRGTPSGASFINYSSTASFKPLPVVEFPEFSVSKNFVCIPTAVTDYDRLPKLTERKKGPVKGSDTKRTRRDRGEMEDIMFKLFERQSNWTLKQLISETDQPEGPIVVQLLLGLEGFLGKLLLLI